MAKSTYNISWTLPGFGHSRIVNYNFLGHNPTLFPKTLIVQTPQFTVTDVKVSISDGDVVVRGAFSGSLPYHCNVRFFFGVDSLLTSNPSQYLYTTAQVFYGGPQSFLIALSKEFFREAGFASGTRVFLVAYADGYFSTSYLEPTTKRRIFTSVNPKPSNVVSVVVP